MFVLQMLLVQNLIAVKMKKTLLILSAALLIGACSRQTTEEYTLPANAEAGKIYDLSSYEEEGTGRLISEGTLVVAENRELKDSRLIALPVKVYKSFNPDPGEPVFWLTGGPGGSNLTYWPPDEVLEQRDVVMIGYRGVDGSTVLDCPDFLDGVFDHNFFSPEAIAQMQKNLAVRQEYWKEQGIDVSCYTMSDVIDDMESARLALNYDRINLLSVSYGTRLAQIFSYRYPETVKRSIMVSVNPPGRFVWDPETIDRQIEQYSDLWAQDSVYSKKKDDLASCVKRVTHNMPERWLFFKIDPDRVRFATFMGLYHTDGAGSVFDTFVAADNGDASGLALVSVMGKFQLKSMFTTWGDLIGKSFADYDPSVDYSEKMKLNNHIIGSPGSQLFAISGAWDIETKDTLYKKPLYTDVQTLMLSGNLDLSTPAEYATEELLPYLNNGKQYILSNYGHVADIMYRQHEAFVRAISSYYATGEADMSGYEQQEVDFTPVRSFPQLAKIALSVAVGVLLLITGIVFLIRFLVRRRKKS